MIDTIFFDFNGTIIDDVDLCLNILNEMLEENGKVKISKERYLEIFRFPIIEYYKLAGFDFSDVSFEELSKVFIKKYQQASLSCKLYDGVIDTLENFKNKGIRLILLSASEIKNLTEQVIHFGLDKYFDKILGISDIYARSKTEVGLNYLMESKINPKNALMLGDTLHDKEVSDEMGISSVLFSGGHQSRKVLAKACGNIVSSYKEFERLISDLNENSN